NLSEDVFKLYRLDEVTTLLDQADFVGVQIKEKEAEPFYSYCAVALKAS
ncbi:MAG: hypothetical protein GY861_11495, partial [bacterium]|nr:hypothetical protein [bacterium]